MVPAPRKTGKNSRVLYLIAIYKFVKGLSLLLLGFGLLHLLHRDVEASVQHWIEVIRVDPDNHYVHRLLLKLFNVTPKQLKELSIGTFVYAGLFLTEGAGLALKKRWAEYMTVITTALLIPLEVYEIYRHATSLRVFILAVNVATVWYLIRHVRR